MTFKNKRGEVPSYVIGLIIAIVVLLVAIGAVVKIKNAQNQAGQQTSTCESVAGGTCQGEECTTGTIPFASCPNNGYCCKAS